MNYIYDILLNFNERYYDFFDWNDKDSIIHIRKIPVFKVDPKIYQNLKNNKVIVCKEFLDKIFERTEAFENHKVKIINYACLISNGLEVIGIMFNENGNTIKYSDLLIDEFDEVIEVCMKLNNSDIKYKVVNKMPKYTYLTRKEIDIINYLFKEIDKLERKKNCDKIKYLYYELFDEKSDDLSFIINKLKKTIKNYKNKFYLRAYNIFKMVSLNQK